MNHDDDFKRGAAPLGHGISVLTGHGSAREVPRSLKQLQWLHALFAYAEVQNNPSLPVIANLERIRTVPARRWHYHRLLLDAHAALLCRFARQRVAALRRKVVGMIEHGVSYESVERGLGAFQKLDAAELVEHCPFFAGDEANTYWEGWVTAPESAEAPAHTVSVVLSGLRDCAPELPWVGTRQLVMVAGHALVKPREVDTWSVSFDEPVADPLELCYSFWLRELCTPNSGVLGVTPTTLVDAVPLTSGRAAWAVGIGVVEAEPVFAADAEQALGAAVELVATLTRGQRRAAEEPWQLPIMSAAQVARESVSAVWDAFSTLGTSVYAREWRATCAPCIYDSKYLYALSPPSSARTLSLRAGRYETALDVAIGQEPVSVSGHRMHSRQGDSGAPARRWSMLYFRGAKSEDKTGA
ncbi:MAG TPA: hypothetical protein VI197_09260 [Polyangiaceae bacterium]